MILQRIARVDSGKFHFALLAGNNLCTSLVTFLTSRNLHQIDPWNKHMPFPWCTWTKPASTASAQPPEHRHPIGLPSPGQ